MRSAWLTLLLLSVIAFTAPAQNLPACDSLVIDCCTYGPNTISLTATNNSSVLFDYPSFVFLNSNLDTIAKETVFYFGISSSPQPHVMDLVSPLTLPLAGYLNLYMLFGDSLACSFPLTLTNLTQYSNTEQTLQIVPNPVKGTNTIKIILPGNLNEPFLLLISDSRGVTTNIQSIIQNKSSLELNISHLRTGLYQVRILSSGKYHSGRFLKL